MSSTLEFTIGWLFILTLALVAGYQLYIEQQERQRIQKYVLNLIPMFGEEVKPVQLEELIALMETIQDFDFGAIEDTEQ